MKRSLALCLLAIGCSPEMGALRQAVIDGKATPDELGYPIDRLQRGAVLGQLSTVGTKTYQGCSGTLVGDRVVATACHCVVANQQAWLAGAAAVKIDPTALAYIVGDDVQQPRCRLQAETIHLHPAMAVDAATGRIAHDVALVVLSEPASAVCPEVVPVIANREPLTEALVGTLLLQGGFGSTDGTYKFSPIRYWSLVEVFDVVGEWVTVIDVDRGFPTFGDSGSGILHRFADGSLRNLGVCSIGRGRTMDYIRMDDQTALLDEILDADRLCGPVPEEGRCRDGAVVACTPGVGFRSDDCRAQGRDCVVGQDGRAGCVCSCDENPWCEDGCACDPHCPCACDSTTECTADCACDPDCHKPGCGVAPGRPTGSSSDLAFLAALGGIAALARRRRAVGRSPTA